MSKDHKKTIQPGLHPERAGKMTRREFVAQGLVAAQGALFAPSLFSLLGGSRSGFAAECPGPSAAPMVPFLLFDCAGGAGLAGNWVVGKQGGAEDFLASYDRMGVPRNPQSGEPIDKQFGAPMYESLSQVRKGIVSAASEAARKNLRMATICNVSQDDTSSNLLSPVLLVARAGLRGVHIASGLGTSNSLTGGNSASPIVAPEFKPLNVTKVADVIDALSYGPVLKSLSPAKLRILARTIANLSRSQSKRLGSMTLGQELQHLSGCGYSKNIEYSSVPEGVDPRTNSICQSLFGISPSSAGDETKNPAILFNVLQGNSGPGVITFGGCDYHDGTQTSGDAKDLEIGTEIGRAVELAYRLKKPLFFGVCSDGSVYSDQGTRNWRSDSGTKGLAVMGYYNPLGAPSVSRFQLGHFTDGQGVERTTYAGGDPKRVAYTIFANYLSVNRQLGSFGDFVPVSEFDPAQLEAHLVFS